MFGFHPVIVWLVLLIVLLVIEMLTLGLTTIWFAGGALIAGIVAAFDGPIWLQITLFTVISLVLLIFTRPIAMRSFNKDREKTNAEGLIGQQAIVVGEINNLLGVGQVIINGMEWSARARDDSEKISVGEVVVIRDISGVKLIVEKQVNEKQ